MKKGNFSFSPVVRYPTFRKDNGKWLVLKNSGSGSAIGRVCQQNLLRRLKVQYILTMPREKRQDITVFVNLSVDEEQDFLHAYRVEGESNRKAGVYVVEQKADDSAKILGDVSQVTNPDKIYLAIVKDNKITQLKKASLRPTNGWNSFDTRQFEKNGEALLEVHLGNKVVEIEYDTSKVSKVLDKNGEPLVLGNDDGTTSFVRMKNPFDTNAKYIKNWME